MAATGVEGLVTSLLAVGDDLKGAATACLLAGGRPGDVAVGCARSIGTHGWQGLGAVAHAVVDAAIQTHGRAQEVPIAHEVVAALVPFGIHPWTAVLSLTTTSCGQLVPILRALGAPKWLTIGTHGWGPTVTPDAGGHAASWATAALKSSGEGIDAAWSVPDDFIFPGRLELTHLPSMPKTIRGDLAHELELAHTRGLRVILSPRTDGVLRMGALRLRDCQDLRRLPCRVELTGDFRLLDLPNLVDLPVGGFSCACLHLQNCPGPCGIPGGTSIASPNAISHISGCPGLAEVGAPFHLDADLRVQSTPGIMHKDAWPENLRVHFHSMGAELMVGRLATRHAQR